MPPQKDKLRVMVCLRTLLLNEKMGGAETQALRTIGSLTERGHKGLVVAGTPGWHLPTFEKVNAHQHEIPIFWIHTPPIRALGSIYYFLVLGLCFLTVLNSYRLVQVTSIHPRMTLVALMAHWSRKKVVFRVTGSDIYKDTEKAAKPGALYLRALRHTGRGYIAQNPEIIDKLTELGIPRQKIAYLTNGVDTQRFTPPTGDVNYLRKQLDLPTDVPIVICVSRLSPEKRVDVALRAFYYLLQESPEALLLILGHGAQQEQVDLAEELGIIKYVTFMEYVNHIEHYLQAANLFVLSSDREGHPNALLEAMACQLPCVVTDVTGNRQTLTHDYDGILTPPGNPEIMGGHLVEMLTNTSKRERLAQQARQTILEQYSLEIMLNRYEQFYEDVAQENPEL